MFKIGKRPTKVIMHCAATPDADIDNERWYNLDIREVRKWHKARGWRDVGYHYFIKRDGTIQEGRPVGKRGAHTRGHNWDIGVCYAGSHRPTMEQIKALKKLAEYIREEHGLNFFDWHCHNEYANKDCPGFSREVLINTLLKDMKEIYNGSSKPQRI